MQESPVYVAPAGADPLVLIGLALGLAVVVLLAVIAVALLRMSRRPA
jgi:hypothetical protein